MDWIQSLSEWAKTTLEQAGTSPLALPLAFLLGLASAVASACCTLPVFAAIVGLIMGGAVSVCSLGCNPGIFIILGVAVLQGYTLWMFGVLIAYAIGFSLPLAALMLGVSFGKSAIRFKKADTVIRRAAGVLLIGVGFYFFRSF